MKISTLLLLSVFLIGMISISESIQSTHAIPYVVWEFPFYFINDSTLGDPNKVRFDVINGNGSNKIFNETVRVM
ncbi:MAG: hypothetical protein ACREAK_01055, partial [Nitrosarchaeum sp.]